MLALLPFMLVGAFLGTGLAVAQSANDETPQKKPAGYLARFDEKFRNADKDGDGALTKTEAESAGMGRVVEHFDKLDADRDGKVTRSEIRALVRQRLSS
ncbi:hypothetical protein GCM10027343_10110 [Noviherbaspirillum agri]